MTALSMIAKGTALAQQSPSTKNSNKNNVVNEHSSPNDMIAIAQPCSSYNWVNIYNSTTMSKDTSTITKNDNNSHHHNSTTNPSIHNNNNNNNPKQLHFYCPGEQQCRKHSAGTVYGGGPPHSPACYTADSSICSAARHAGIIDGDGGVFSVEFAAGLPQYSSSVRNGIRTIAWADFPKSIVLYPSCALLPSTKKEMVRSTLASEDCPIQEQEEKVPLLTTYKAWEDFQKKIALATNTSTSSALLNKNNFDRFLCSTYTKDSCSGRFYCPGSASCPKKNSYGSSLVWGIGPNGEQVATGDSAPCVFARYMNVIDDVQGGWYELTPATGFQSFIGDASNPRNGATVRPWRQPYQNCFTVAKPIMYFSNNSEEEEKTSSLKKKEKNTTTNETSSVAEPAVVKNQAEKLQGEKGGEEYF